MRSSFRGLIHVRSALIMLVASGAFFACRQTAGEKGAAERQTTRAPEARRVEMEKPAEGFVRGIEAVPEVEPLVESLLALSPPGAAEPAEMPPELSETVRERLDDESVSVGHKIYLLTVYSEKAKWLPPEWLKKLAADAKAADLMPELNYSTAQLLRNELKRLPEKVADGDLTSAEGATLTRELGDSMVEFSRAAYEGRKRETLYTMGLLGAYYDRAMALAGGREPKDADAVEGLTAELERELLERLDAGEMLRVLVGPPWLLYAAMWRLVPPPAAGRDLIWGCWSTSVGQALLVGFRAELAAADWKGSFQMGQRMRMVLADELAGIEWGDNAEVVVRGLIESIAQAPLPASDRKAAREMLADFEEFSAVWREQRQQEREKRHRLVAEGKSEEALRADDMYGRMAMMQYHEFIDRVEDIIRAHSAAQARKEREAQQKQQRTGRWRKVEPGEGHGGG